MSPAGKASSVYRALGIASLILLLLAPIGAKLGLLPGLIALMLFALAFILGVVPVIRAMLALRPADAGARRRQLLISGALGLPAVVIALVGMGGASGAPPIHDVSTDLEDRPAFSAAAERRGPEANSLQPAGDVAAQQRAAYPDLQPLRSELEPPQAFKRARACLDQMGLEVYAADAQAGRIEAEASTFWFAFKDDMVVRIRPANPGSHIDLRSVSRVGQGDMGANAARIREFQQRFTEGCD